MSVETAHQGRDSVESQTEAVHREGTVWHLCHVDPDAVVDVAAEDSRVLELRGEVGETPFLMLCLFGHVAQARTIAQRHPRAALAVYDGDEYRGENALHIAIVNKRLEFARWLAAEYPSLLEDRARGRFFRVGEPCYYGELPLLFAASTNQPDMWDMLVDMGEDPGRADSHGNTALHMCVLHNLPEMYYHVRDSWARVNRYEGRPDLPAWKGMTPLWRQLNGEGFSPLMLAAKGGYRSMFESLLESHKRVTWTWGPVSCTLLPLDELDFVPGKARGALEWMVEYERTELLMLPRVKELLNKKWQAFAKRKFQRAFVVTVVYLLLFVATVIWDGQRGRSVRCPPFPAAPSCWLLAAVAPHFASATRFSGNMLDGPDTVGWAVGATEAVVLLGALAKLRREVAEMRFETPRQYFGARGAGMIENLGSLAFCGLTLLHVVLRLLDQFVGGLEPFFASLRLAQVGAAVIYMFFFLLGFRLTGHFVVLLGEMLFLDVARFGALMVVFVLGFSTAFIVVGNESGIESFASHMSSSLTAMLGEVSFESTQGPHPWLSAGLTVLSTLVMPLLLSNVLVAMLGDTYARLNSKADSVWWLQRARIQQSIEREMGADEREDSRNKYWTVADGLRYLQIIESDPYHFRPATPGGAAVGGTS